MISNKKRAITIILALAAILLVTVPAAVIREEGQEGTAPVGTVAAGGNGAQPVLAEPGQAVTVADRVDNQGNYQLAADENKYQARELGTLTLPWNSPAASSGLSAKVTAQKSFDDEAIAIYFYVAGPATYTVQEQVQGAWQDREGGVAYSGTGGLLAAMMVAGEEVKTLRLLKLESDGSTVATAAFTVRRSEVEAAGGTKTYSG